MDGKDKELFKKFEDAVNSKLDKKEAIRFLSALNIDEYNRIIEMLVSQDTPDISDDTKHKILIVFRELRDELARRQ